MSDLSKELVAELLLGNVSDELLSSYIKLAGILTEAGYTSHFDQLEALYSQYNALNVDILELQPQVDAILLNSLDVVLSQCGVRLTPDLDISLRIIIAEGILLFDITEDVDMLYRKLENSTNDTEGLCKILSYTLSLDLDVLYPAFDHVESMIIDRMRALIEQGMAVEKPDFNESSTFSDLVAKRYNKLKVFRPDTIGGKIASAVDPTDASFENLYAYNAGQLMKKSSTEAVDDLYSLAAMSSMSLESAYSVIGECLDDLFTDPIERAKAERVRGSLKDEYSKIFGDTDEQV